MKTQKLFTLILGIVAILFVSSCSSTGRYTCPTYANSTMKEEGNKISFVGRDNNTITGIIEEDGIAFTRLSILSGKMNTRKIKNVTINQLRRFEAGDHVQNAMPSLSEDDREFFISGSTPEEWDAAFKEDNIGNKSSYKR